MSNETQQPTTAGVPQEAAAPSSAIVPVAPRPVVSFDADDPVSLYMDSRIFAQLQRVAAMMAKANLVPAHLRGDEKIADCFLVAAQAFRWRMDPFSVAQHSFVTQGKLGYEGKLIAGLINASGRLESNLKPLYAGPAGDDARAVTIIGRIKGEAEDRTIEGSVGAWKTTNEKWKSMPDQMLFYRGAREWARRHMPEVMLGISADEEIVEMERGPSGTYEAPRGLAQLTERLQAAAPVAPSEPAAPECAGCGKKEPTCDAQDAEGRAFHKACLEMLKKAPPAGKPKQSRLTE